MNEEKAREVAKRTSYEEGCVQHVNFNVKTQKYQVSDWYNEDSTVATFVNGLEK